MSQGYYKRVQRKKRMFLIVGISIVFVIVLMVIIFQAQARNPDSEYGEIEDVNVPKEDILDPTENEAKIPIRVVTFDVGDALSVLVDYGQTEVLYDAGYYDNGKDVAEKMAKFVDGPLEYMIISHSHADHCGGTPEIFKKYTVQNVITSGETSGDSEQFDYAMQAIKDSGCNVIEDADLTFDLGEGFTMNTIETYDPGETDNVNDLSVIAYFKRDDDTFLITGDAEQEAERKLLGKIDSAKLLIAGHHMSNTSNSYKLLEECKPSVIVVSCAGPGKSEYGFPHRGALRRCLVATTEIYATYKSGDIVVSFEGGGSFGGGDITINCDEEDVLTLGG